MEKTLRSIALLFAMMLLLGACGSAGKGSEAQGASQGTENVTDVPELTTAPEPEGNVTPEPTITETPVATPEPTEVPEPTKAVETATPTPEPSLVTATIVVEYGNTASVVCDKIEAAGIVANGDALKAYLVEHNLADFINVGSYVLSEGMSLEEIANVLTK